MTTMDKEQAVIVTTAHRGVFFGYATEVEGKTIELKRARNCVYWSADVKGFMGLAGAGPTATCKVGPQADIVLHDVTAVVSVTPAAVEAWERGPSPRRITGLEPVILRGEAPYGYGYGYGLLCRPTWGRIGGWR